MSQSPTRIALATFAFTALLAVTQAHTAGNAALPPRSNDTSDGQHGARESSAGDVRTEYLRSHLRFERGSRRDGSKAADFVARGLGYGVYLSSGHARVVLGSPGAAAPEVITLRLVGSDGNAQAAGRKELPGRTNHFIGNDPRHWHSGVASFAEVEYRNVYPGVDLVYYGNQRQLEYDFIVAPGASHSVIGFRLVGASRVSLDRDGNLIVTTASGQLVHRAPLVYQEKNGGRQHVKARYVIGRNGRIGFRIGRYDKRLPLVIDPVLSYSTYLGGTAQERLNGVAVDAQGSIFVVGETFSPDFPVTSDQVVRTRLGDVFVARLDAPGEALTYVTYLGGRDYETGTAIRVDGEGSAYVSGATFSPDFPTAHAIQTTHKGQSDGFVAKLDANGGLVYSTLLGGSQEDYANGLAIDGSGRVHIGGHTISADFPLVSPLQDSLGGSPALRSTDGGETWSGMKTGLNTAAVRGFAIDPVQPTTMYAGTESDGVFKSVDGGSTWARTSSDLPPLPVHALALGEGVPAAVYAANAVGVYRSRDAGESWTALPIWGWATSLAVGPGSPSVVYAGLGPNAYPAGVFKSIDGGDTWIDTGLRDGALALTSSGSTVYAATVNGVFRSDGDSGWTWASAGLSGEVWALAADPVNASIAYAGTTDGLFTTTSAGAEWMPVPELTGAPTAAVAIAPSDPATIYVVTWWGSAVTNDGGQTWRGIASGNVAFGIAVHPQVPTTVYAGAMRGFDAFIATLSADGSRLEYSTFFGGSSHEQVTDLALDPEGGRYIAGTTHSRDLPVLNAVQPHPGDLMDVFAAKVAGDGSLAYATYLAGWHSDYAARIDVDALGQAFVTGLSYSGNFPVANAVQPRHAGGFSDVFVSVLNPAGNGFVYSTFLGGSDMENDASQSIGPDVAVTPAGEAYVTGATKSADFPTTPDAFQRTHRGGVNDVFVTKFDAAGRIQYSTLLGGTGADNVRAIAVDAEGTAVVTGWTDSPDWPVKNAVQPLYAGTEDGFIARIREGTTPADTTAPVTTVVLSGTPGSAGWYRTAVQVTLSATDGDDGSGVRIIHYSRNGGPFEEYTGPFAITAEGTTEVVVQATDNAGNVEPAASATVKIDTAGPAVGVTSPATRDYLHTDDVPVAFSAIDDISGVDGSATVTLDGTAVAGNTLALLSLPLGTHSLRVTAIDAAGNESAASVTFRIVATVDSLIGSVNAFAGEMQESAYNSLMAKLTEAKAALERGNVNTARNKLEEVVNYCTRESGRAISTRAATSLITDARYVLGTL